MKKNHSFALGCSFLVMFALIILGAIAIAHTYNAHVVLTAEQLTQLQHIDWRATPVLMGGVALDCVSGAVTAAGATLTGWTVAAGDSLQVRNCDPSKMVKMLSYFCDNQAAGQIRIRSPKLHDVSRGITTNIGVSDVTPLMPFGQSQRLTPQDVLIVEQSGSAVAGDVESGSMIIWYEDLPGQNARFISPKDLITRGVNVKPVQNTVTATAGGTYSGAVTITTTEDLMKANTDYALIGFDVSVECCTVTWRGADTGNLRLAGPGNETLKHVTGDWFRRLSMAFDLPLIPVINSANKNNTFVEIIQDENLAAVVVNSIFVELAPRI